MTDTDFDLDDEPVLTAEGEVAAAICGHQVVMQRGDALTANCSTNSTASFRKSWPRFSRRRTPRLPICAPSPTASSPTPLRCAYMEEDIEPSSGYGMERGVGTGKRSAASPADADRDF